MKIHTKKQFANNKPNNHSEKSGFYHWYTIVEDSSQYPINYVCKLNDRHVAYLQPLKAVSPKHLVYFGHFTENRMLAYIDTWRRQEAIERRGTHDTNH